MIRKIAGRGTFASIRLSCVLRKFRSQLQVRMISPRPPLTSIYTATVFTINWKKDLCYLSIFLENKWLVLSWFSDYQTLSLCKFWCESIFLIYILMVKIQIHILWVRMISLLAEWCESDAKILHWNQEEWRSYLCSWFSLVEVRTS